MTTFIQTHKNNAVRTALVKRSETFIEKLMPRRGLMISTGLILAGLSIPVLIATQLLTFTVLLGFAAFALVATGGVLTLILCGEI